MRNLINLVEGASLLYHGTLANDEPITQFRPMTHFGSKMAATHRGMIKVAAMKKDMGLPPPSLISLVIYPVHLDVSNPLRINDEKDMKHGGFPLVDMLHYDLKAITAEERNEMGGGQCSAEIIAEVLSRKGFDGFVYRNVVEDAGHDSFVNFRSDQVSLAGAPIRITEHASNLIAMIKRRG